MRGEGGFCGWMVQELLAKLIEGLLTGFQALFTCSHACVKGAAALFPIAPASEEAKEKREVKLKQSGQEFPIHVWFCKEMVSNA
jgi:hypothetical protein